MATFKYVINEVHGTQLWASEPLLGKSEREVAQAVLSGWISGRRRWAQYAGGGALIYGLTETGKVMAKTPIASVEA